MVLGSIVGRDKGPCKICVGKEVWFAGFHYEGKGLGGILIFYDAAPYSAVCKSTDFLV
jgi:hypothetical protein